MRAARRWLEGGGVLVVFPAGAVSSVRRGATVVDTDWQPGVAALAEWTNASVVPAFVSGQPGWMLRLAGAVHPLVRSALLPRDLLRRQGSRVEVRLGAVCPAFRLARLPDRRARLAYLRARTYSLSRSAPGGSRLRWRTRLRAAKPIVPPMPVEALRRDVEALTPADTLLHSGPYSVHCATAAALPHVLQEIGRLREVTFRAAGEGTGRSTDLDRFDAEYLHLFVWHRERGEVAGAYRIGRTDMLMMKGGVRALYSRTLFRFGARLIHELGPSLELGRSFVVTEYQRGTNVLGLLWRGIGALVAREPRYRRLFGPVTISAEYRSLSRQLMAQFLGASRTASSLSKLVAPKRPFPAEADASALVETRVVTRIADVDALVEEMERSRGLPVLVRQYLKLNARLLGFSVDPAFGDALDGLIVVDLADVPDARLIRYLGPDSAARLRAAHRSPGCPAPGALSDPLMA
jgi:putative hemolysin